MVEATGPDGAVVNYSVSATDNVDVPVNVECSPPPDILFPMGSIIVHCTALDSSGNRARDTFTVTVSEPQVINDLVTFKAVGSSYKATAETSGCPTGFVGKFSFTATLTNTSSSTLFHLKVPCITLTKGNLMENADGGPGGEGATMTVPLMGDYSDGELSPGESLDVPFSICLKEWRPFSFFVDVLGMVE